MSRAKQASKAEGRIKAVPFLGAAGVDAGERTIRSQQYAGS